MTRMALSRTTRRTSSPKSYAALVSLFPLRPLRDEVDYDNALEMAESLVGLTAITDDQADYLDVLVDIIRKYESHHHPVEGQGSPLQTLRNLLEEHDMSASDLGRLLGNRALGSAILRGQRHLSKTHVRILAAHFKVSTDLFLA